jgi:hypothetical protein
MESSARDMSILPSFLCFLARQRSRSLAPLLVLCFSGYSLNSGEIKWDRVRGWRENGIWVKGKLYTGPGC